MNGPIIKYFPVMDTNDVFIKTGFVPAFIRITNLGTGLGEEWCITQGNDAGISRVAAGNRTVNTDKGIKLVKFVDEPGADASTDPTAYEVGNWWESNGFQITSDAVLLSDNAMICLEIWPMTDPIIRAVHDGTTSSNTYFEDSSIDFKEAGVSTGWIVYNQTNGDYAYVGEIQKPEGKDKWCRCTTLTSQGGSATTAADFDTADVLFIFPKHCSAYPLSDIGLMT